MVERTLKKSNAGKGNGKQVVEQILFYMGCSDN